MNCSSSQVDTTTIYNQVLTAHKADYVKHPGTGKTTNSGNAYAVTLNPAPPSYADQMGVIITVNADSSGASTLNINGLGAKPIKKANGNDVTNLKANGVYTLRYNADTGNFILQGEGASGNAVASDLLSGKTASTDAGDIVGTMPNKGAMTITPGTADRAIPSGFHNGSGIVLGDPNLIPSNILSGKNIFGVSGSVIAGSRTANGSQTITIAKSPDSQDFTINMNLLFKPRIIVIQVVGLLETAYSQGKLSNPVAVYFEGSTWESAVYSETISSVRMFIGSKVSSSSATLSLRFGRELSADTTKTVNWLAIE